MRKAHKNDAAPPLQDVNLQTARRQPVQARTQRKVMQILEATAQLIEKMPLDDISTSDIAKAADITTGTVYRFFPHREAIFESLLTRYLEKMRVHYEEILTNSKARTGPEIITEVIDLQIRFMLTEPGFKGLWSNRELTPQVLRRLRGQANTADIPAMARTFMSDRLGVPLTEETERRLAISAEITNSLLVYAFHRPEGERPGIIAELKRLLTFLMFGPPTATAGAPQKPSAKPKTGG
ncbi:MAG: TetR/AcrR family transcriptional regulator [Rhodospirillaceae bacterium]|nr:TetR/AcrR family transcriptional regulator [Rhodospirillaceae bacterium]